jgi:hypothetical protein
MLHLLANPFNDIIIATIVSYSGIATRLVYVFRHKRFVSKIAETSEPKLKTPTSRAELYNIFHTWLTIPSRLRGTSFGEWINELNDIRVNVLEFAFAKTIGKKTSTQEECEFWEMLYKGVYERLNAINDRIHAYEVHKSKLSQSEQISTQQQFVKDIQACESWGLQMVATLVPKFTSSLRDEFLGKTPVPNTLPESAILQIQKISTSLDNAKTKLTQASSISSEHAYALQATKNRYLADTLAMYAQVAAIDSEIAKPFLSTQLDYIQKIIDAATPEQLNTHLQNFQTNGTFLKDRLKMLKAGNN